MIPARGFIVTERIDDAHPLHPGYPLLPDDLLVRIKGRTFAKEGPGIGIIGFRLTREQVRSLLPVEFTRSGLNYTSWTTPNDMYPNRVARDVAATLYGIVRWFTIWRRG